MRVFTLRKGRTLADYEDEAGRSGQTVFADATLAVSLRNDVTYHDVPAFAFPQKGTKYMDTYDYAFVTGQRDAAFAKARALLGE